MPLSRHFSIAARRLSERRTRSLPPRQRLIVLSHGRRRHRQRHRVLPRESLFARRPANETGRRRRRLQPVVTLCSAPVYGLILVTRLPLALARIVAAHEHGIAYELPLAHACRSRSRHQRPADLFRRPDRGGAGAGASLAWSASAGREKPDRPLVPKRSALALGEERSWPRWRRTFRALPDAAQRGVSAPMSRALRGRSRRGRGRRSCSTASAPAGHCPHVLRHQTRVARGRRGWSTSRTITRSPWRAASPTAARGARRLQRARTCSGGPPRAQADRRQRSRDVEHAGGLPHASASEAARPRR